jgi:hypothetical protein
MHISPVTLMRWYTAQENAVPLGSFISTRCQPCFHQTSAWVARIYHCPWWTSVSWRFGAWGTIRIQQLFQSQSRGRAYEIIFSVIVLARGDGSARSAHIRGLSRLLQASLWHCYKLPISVSPPDIPMSHDIQRETLMIFPEPIHLFQSPSRIYMREYPSFR